jgi:hypothetical protein
MERREEEKDIFEKIEDYLSEKEDEDEEDDEEEYEADDEEIDEETYDLIVSFATLNESRKSQFVAKLIGIGVLEKDKDGNLKPKKKMSKEQVVKKLGRRGKIKKVKNKVKSLLGMK